MNKTKLVSLVYALMGLGTYTMVEAALVNECKAPFKDYNNKIVLSINNVPSAKVIEFTSNFKPKTGWGSCFGTRADLVNFETTQLSNGEYLTKLSLKDDEGLLDLTQTCDIMGTDSGNVIVLPGVVFLLLVV